MHQELRFQCQTGCTRCCEQPGFIYLAEADVPRMAAFLAMTPVDFERKHVYRTRNFIRLRTPKVGRCTFLAEAGCSIHEVKPMQCRSFPFWPELLESKKEWRKTASWCPGIGQGELVTIQLANATADEVRQAHAAYYG
jgi:Fe-S-cluster containining protein